MSPLPPQPLSPLDGRYQRRRHRTGRVPLRGRTEPRPGQGRGRVADRPHRPRAVRLRAARAPRRRAACAPWSPTSARPRSTGSPPSRPITRHDVKAVEYLVRHRLADAGPRRRSPSSPTSPATSEDINNLAYALTVSRGRARGVAAQAPRRHRRARASWPSSYRDDADARPHARPARDAHHHGQGARGVRLPARAHPRRRSRQPSTSASSAARPAPSPRTSPPTRPWTGPRCRASSSRASAWAGTR